MNVKRLIAAIVAGFVFVFASDFLVHGVWLVPDYKATLEVWRPDAEMMARMPFMTAAQLLCVTTFVMIWAKGFADRGCLRCAVIYGLMMGLFSQVNTLINYVIIPMPGALAAKWFAVALVQSVALGVITFLIYKPAAPTTR